MTLDALRSLQERWEKLADRAEHLRGEYERMQPTGVLNESPVLLLELAAAAAKKEYEEESNA